MSRMRKWRLNLNIYERHSIENAPSKAKCSNGAVHGRLHGTNPAVVECEEFLELDGHKYNVISEL